MASNSRNSNWTGMNSICRQDLRLAVYTRDGHTCAYCGAQGPGAGGQATLSLDHITPASTLLAQGQRVDNSATNLVTACLSCNSSRQDTALSAFVSATKLRGVLRQASIDITPFRRQAQAWQAEYGTKSAAKIIAALTGDRP
jgi:hypothetical protein